MKEMLISASVTALLALYERVLGTLKPAINYFVIFCMMVGALCISKMFAYEPVSRIDMIPEYHNGAVPPDVAEILNKDTKYVPKGVPSSHVNPDGTPSAEAVALIRKQGQRDSIDMYNHHVRKMFAHEETLKNLCWYCPNIDFAEGCKMAFSSGMAAVAGGTLHIGFYMAFLTAATQLGITYISEWQQMYEQNCLINWHSHVIMYYLDHMAAHGW